MIVSRRGLVIGGVASLICAPAIVRASSLMPVKAMRPDWLPAFTISPCPLPDGSLAVSASGPVMGVFEMRGGIWGMIGGTLIYHSGNREYVEVNGVRRKIDATITMSLL